MSKRYFTSDFHFNSTLINKYANRPYQDAFKASKFLVDNANTVLSKEDVLFHVGDFCLTSADRHGKEVDNPLDISPDYWITTFGKSKKTGLPKWYFCDSEGKRFIPGQHCYYSWGACHEYRDPCF